MSSSWRDDDEDYKVGGVRGGLRSKPRFSFAEVKLLLEAVKRNRYIILRKFNQGVSAEAKKQTWAEITEQVNSLGENRREVRQIMKKWADLKCDGKRRIAALRGPNGTSLRKKRLGAVEKMVHKILSMSPRGDGDSDVEFGEDDDFSKGTAPAYSYLSIAPTGINLDFSPLSSPEKELGGDPLQSSSEFDMADEGEPIMDFDENDDSLVSSNYSSLPPASSSSAPAEPPSDDARLRIKPLLTYSRNNGQNPNHTSPKSPPGPSSPVASTSDAALPPPPSESPTAAGRPSSSSISAAFAAPPPPASPSSTAAASDSTSPPAAPSAKPLQPPASSALPPKAPCDPFPAPAFARRPQEQVAQLAAQSVQQQQASRALLSSVSQSLEVLAQSVQLLVESQQEFVQESLLLQRETVDILRDFSNTALSMLREKSSGGQTARHQNPPF